MLSFAEVLGLLILATVFAQGVSWGLALFQQRKNGLAFALTSGNQMVFQGPAAMHRATTRTYFWVARQSPRYKFQCAIEYRDGDFVAEGTVLDISQEGWRVKGRRPVRPGTTLSLHVFLPGHSTPLQVDRAVVRWSNGREFGAQLLVLNPEAAACLNNFFTNDLSRSEATACRLPEIRLQ